jgi:ribulose-5-phosphate 4-epimerase/fuculose-1-phosphate aldolase
MTALLSEETRTRDLIASVGASLFERRLSFGSTGNISVRLTDGRIVLTPTNVSLGNLEPADLSLMSSDGVHISGRKPTKEAFLHRCMYCQRQHDNAVVHLHSTYAVAVSILADVNPEDVLPPLTAYYVMRVGTLPLVPYFPPGDTALAGAVEARAAEHHALLLANHGPVVSGKSLLDAQYAIEELEETARLHLVLSGQAVRLLTAEQVSALRSL